MDNVTYGALILVSIVVVIGLFINYARIDNEIIKAHEAKKSNTPWNWE